MAIFKQQDNDPMTELMGAEDRENHRKQSMRVVGIAVFIIVLYAAEYVNFVRVEHNASVIEAIGLAMMEIFQKGNFLFVPPLSGQIPTILFAIIAALIYWCWASYDTRRHMTVDPDKSGGTAHLMTAKEKKAFFDKYIGTLDKDRPNELDDPESESSYFILAQNTFRPNIASKLIGNNSVLVMGSAGTGKSRFFVKPNILQFNASLVITDPSGELLQQSGQALRDAGYIIKVFSLTDMEHSNTYNPLSYVETNQDVDNLIDCFIKNTSKSDNAGDNQFFVDAERLLYSACIFYLKDFVKDSSRMNFAEILRLINMSQVDENNSQAKSPLDEIFEKLPEESIAAQQYKAFKQAAGKTLKSILISCVVRLRPFFQPAVKNLTSSNDIGFEDIGFRKTAIFIVTSQVDRAFDFLGALLYTQIFSVLYSIGEKRMADIGKASLPIPVRFLMDEFANIGEIPEFPSRLATMRKYNLSACVIVQSLTQLQAKYKDNWEELVGNCSTKLLLGSNEQTTLEYMSKTLGQMTQKTRSESLGKQGSMNVQWGSTEVLKPDQIAMLDSKKCIISMQNHPPIVDDKFKLEDHRYYSMLEEGGNNAFNYKEEEAFNNALKELSVLHKSFALANRVRAQLNEDIGISDKLEDAMKEARNEYINMNGKLIALKGNIDELQKNQINEICKKVQIEIDKEPTLAFYIEDELDHTYLPAIMREIEKKIKPESPTCILFSSYIHVENDMELLIGVIDKTHAERTLNILNKNERIKGIIDIHKVVDSEKKEIYYQIKIKQEYSSYIKKKIRKYIESDMLIDAI